MIDQVFRQMRHVDPDPHFLGALGTAVLPQHARNICICRIICKPHMTSRSTSERLDVP